MSLDRKYDFFKQRAVYAFAEMKGGLRVTGKRLGNWGDFNMFHRVATSFEDYEKLAAIRDFKQIQGKEIISFFMPTGFLVFEKKSRIEYEIVEASLAALKIEMDEFISFYEDQGYPL